MKAIILLLLLLAIGGCADEAAEAPAPQSPCREERFEGSGFIVCRPTSAAKLRLFAAGPNDAPRRAFRDLPLDARKVAFAMNAGMFDEGGHPIGYTIVDGKQLKPVNLRKGPGNFHMKPNGVFMVLCGGKQAAIFPSDAIPEFRCAPVMATQSGPMLVIDGKLHPGISPNGDSLYIRNGVGIAPGGKPLFVISTDPVSFGRMARFFRDRLKAKNALYFDGSVSSLWDPANGRMDVVTDLGPIIVAMR